MKLKGTNFQPWPEFEMDIDKLTVLVGPSNHGKSALYRALRGILRNDLPPEFVRNEQEEPLEIELDVDGHHIEASRSRKGSTKYVVDGKLFSSLGGKLPEVVENLKFGVVTLGDFSLDPIFAEQNDSQFLIDPKRYKPSEINAILGAFASTEKLDGGKKEANLRISQRNGEAKTLATEIRDAEERKSKLSDISEKLQTVAAGIDEFETGIQAIEQQSEWLTTALYHRRRLVPLTTILKSLTVPDTSEVTIAFKQTYHTKLAVTSLRRHGALKKTQDSLTGVSEQWSEVVKAYKQQKAAAEIVELLHKLENDSSEKYGNRLESLVLKINTEIRAASGLKNSIRYVADVILTKERLKELSNQCTAVEFDLAEAEQEANRGACSKCGKPLEHICE